MKQTCADITINKRIGILKRCFRDSHIDLPYHQSIDKMKERVHTYDMIEENDLRMIRSYIKKLPDNHENNLFSKSLVFLLMNTAARIGEILKIKKENVNLNACEILLTETKTKEDRIVFITETAVPTLKKIMQLKTDHPY